MWNPSLGAAHHHPQHPHHNQDHSHSRGGDGNDDDDDDDWHGSIHDLQHAPDLDDVGTLRHGVGHFQPRPVVAPAAAAALRRSSASGASSSGGNPAAPHHQRQSSLSNVMLFSSASTSRTASTRSLGGSLSFQGPPPPVAPPYFLHSASSQQQLQPPVRRTRHMSIDHTPLGEVGGGGTTTMTTSTVQRGSLAVGAPPLRAADTGGGGTVVGSRRRIFSADHVRFLLPSSVRQLSPTSEEPQPTQRRRKSSTAEASNENDASPSDTGTKDASRSPVSVPPPPTSAAASEIEVQRPSSSSSSSSTQRPSGTTTPAGTQVAFDLSKPEPLMSRISSLPVPEETQSQEEEDDDDDDDDDEEGQAGLPPVPPLHDSILSLSQSDQGSAAIRYQYGEGLAEDDIYGYSYQEHDPDTMGGGLMGESDASIFRDRPPPPCPDHDDDGGDKYDEEGVGGRDTFEYRRRVMSASSVPSSLSSRGPLEGSGNNSYGSSGFVGSAGGGGPSAARAGGGPRQPSRKSPSDFDDSGYNYDDEDDFGNDQSSVGATTFADDVSQPYAPESHGPEPSQRWLRRLFCCVPFWGRADPAHPLHRPSGALGSSTSTRNDEPPPQRCLTKNRVAVFVVRYAPCFCFMGFKIQTDRLVLGRLNVLLAFFALYQMGAAMFLAIVLLNPSLVDRTIPEQSMNLTDTESKTVTEINPAIWNMNGNIYVAGVAAFLIFTSAVLTWRVVRFVNLVGSVRYLWVLSWALPFEAFCMVCLVDYHNVTNIWVTHWWNAYQMAWFRRRYCAPGTFNTLCTVPFVYTGSDGDEWCQVNYNSTDCIEIRNEAQQQTNAFLRVFYTVSAVWCLIYIILIFLTMDTLEHIITKPLVQKSIQSNLPGWLSLPMVFCVLIGCVIQLAGRTPAGLQYLGTQYAWISLGYFAVGGLFLLAILSGWFISWSSIERTIDKKRKLVAVHLLVGSMITASLLLIAVFSTTIMFSVNLVTSPISDDMRGTIACVLGSTGGCTMCELEENRCPEWTTEDVTTIYKTQALAIATGSAIFFIYAVRAARFGFTMRQHLLSYQIEYV